MKARKFKAEVVLRYNCVKNFTLCAKLYIQSKAGFSLSNWKILHLAMFFFTQTAVVMVVANIKYAYVSRKTKPSWSLTKISHLVWNWSDVEDTCFAICVFSFANIGSIVWWQNWSLNKVCWLRYCIFSDKAWILFYIENYTFWLGDWLCFSFSVIITNEFPRKRHRGINFF